MIDKTKTYTTSDGYPVEIYRTDGGGDRPVHGAVLIDGRWLITAWQADGQSPQRSISSGLVEVKPKLTLEMHINVYRDKQGLLTGGFSHPTRPLADATAALTGGRLACIQITREITEGEGL